MGDPSVLHLARIGGFALSRRETPAGLVLLPPGGVVPAPRKDREPDKPGEVRARLASAHEDPGQAMAEWSKQGLALLPLGRRFGAIRIPGVLVHAAAQSDDRETVAAVVAHHLQGPVIHDLRFVGPTYFALVPWWRDIYWASTADTPYLGPGWHLGVPDIGRTGPPGRYWVTPPRYRNDLCRREDVFDFIVRMRRQLGMGEEDA